MRFFGWGFSRAPERNCLSRHLGGKYSHLHIPVLEDLLDRLDNKQLLREARSLERRRGPSGRDRTDHPKGSRFHDDLVNAAAGAIWLAIGKARVKPRVVRIGEGISYRRHPLEPNWL